MAESANLPSKTVSSFDETYDVVVYGGTSAGVIAAVQAKKMFKAAVSVGPDKHLGGRTSSGRVMRWCRHNAPSSRIRPGPKRMSMR